MFHSNSVENGGRPELDEPSRTESRSDTHSGAGSPTGIRRKRYYGVIPRVAATSGWKATFMSV
jgi:hypothetical protein